MAEATALEAEKKKPLVSDIVLEQICSKCGNGWCLLREMMTRDLHYKSCLPDAPIGKLSSESCRIYGLVREDKKYTERAVAQFHLTSVYKLNESRKQGRGIDWSEANMMWCSEGYAQAFGELYKQGRKLDLDKFYRVVERRAEKIRMGWEIPKTPVFKRRLFPVAA